MFEILTWDQLKPRLDEINFKEGHLHHTYLPKGSDYKGTDESAQALQEGMKTYHKETMHWSDIGQHVSLLTDGRFITGRPFRTTPASILGYNDGAFACEMLGNFDTGNEILTGLQKESALKLAKYFDDRKLYFRFHRENSTKTCPGTSINKDVFMAQARGYVAPVVSVVPNGIVNAPLAVHEGNELVRIIQELCKEAGLLDYDRKTLKVDGVWGERTESALPLLKKNISKVFPKLKWLVRFLQQRLMDCGYALPKYGKDGDYGDETIAAVKAFQRDNHLVVDGQVGRLTWHALLMV